MVSVVVMTLGSAGDLHPFLAIARALQEQGADVVFASQAPHEAEVRAQGVRFEAIASAQDHARTLAHPQLWHPVNGLGVLWRHLGVPAIGPSTALLQRMAQRSAGPLRVLASPLAMGARLVADILPIQLTLAHTAPNSLRSIASPMWMGAWHVPDATPVWLRRRLWALLDRWKLEPMARPALDAWRLARGLPPIAGSVFGDWLCAKGAQVGLWPARFARSAPDWPAALDLAGFALYDGGSEAISEDEAQVVFYPGSIATPAQGAMAQAASSLTEAGVRHRTTGRPGDLAHLPTLLAHAHVFVHHGGIGAIAQGLRAGVHQRILPSAFDQAHNAWLLSEAQGQSCRSTARTLLRDIRRDLAQPRPTAWPLQLSSPEQPNTAVQFVVDLLMQGAR